MTGQDACTARHRSVRRSTHDKEHADLLEAICQNIPDAICMIDRDWNIQSWNTGAEIMFGYPRTRSSARASR